MTSQVIGHFAARPGVPPARTPTAQRRPGTFTLSGECCIRCNSAYFQGGCIGMSQLMGYYPVQARFGGGPVQLIAQRVSGHAAALVGEQEVGQQGRRVSAYTLRDELH